MENYWLYASIYASLPYVAFFIYCVRRRQWIKTGDKHFLAKKAALKILILRILQFLYLPIAIAVGRLGNFNSEKQLSVDPAISISSINYYR